MAESTKHAYHVHVTWTGNLGAGTSDYRAYSRAHEITAADKPVLLGSSDPTFRGDPSRYNPEELLVASLSACHMLWYLHLCTEAGIVVSEYTDAASGTMVETPEGDGVFSEVVLRPVVRLQVGADAQLATALHERAHKRCFIARSVNFAVRCESQVQTEAVLPGNPPPAAA